MFLNYWRYATRDALGDSAIKWMFLIGGKVAICLFAWTASGIL